MPRSEAIEKALKRLENAEIKVIIRGGDIVKILTQNVETQERDGVQTVHRILADII